MTDTSTPASMPIGRRDARGTTAPPASQAGQNPYPAHSVDPQPAPPAQSHPAPPRPELPPSPPSAERAPNPLAQWWQAARGDSAARKDRNGQQRWLMRWMREQPTSVADYLDYYLHQREERPDGRRGWGLRTAIPIINGSHALAYRAYGLTVGLALTLAAYALGWMAQRPGRALLLTIALIIVHTNLSTWLSGS
ncbi:hypothetical protein [Streptosporangium lutulentum]|uniref:Uncharacterized protein n=1 Tax=Streptosporangium lutulentum TaxID=1461250 RepID=A0ABT9QV93_9ACTN|nr:hypothetical protein [Streptosporangium lutulentum]MDP9850326.1 hypothetical protein [Streptosporangium lutulentum]